MILAVFFRGIPQFQWIIPHIPVLKITGMILEVPLATPRVVDAWHFAWPNSDLRRVRRNHPEKVPASQDWGLRGMFFPIFDSYLFRGSYFS